MRLSTHQRAKALRLRSEGMTHRVIAEDLGVTHHRVHYFLVGVPRGNRPPFVPPKAKGYARRFDRDEARTLRESGLTYQQVGDRLGVSPVAIYYAVKLNDCQTRHRYQGAQ